MLNGQTNTDTTWVKLTASGFGFIDDYNYGPNDFQYNDYNLSGLFDIALLNPRESNSVVTWDIVKIKGWTYTRCTVLKVLDSYSYLNNKSEDNKCIVNGLCGTLRYSITSNNIDYLEFTTPQTIETDRPTQYWYSNNILYANVDYADLKSYTLTVPATAALQGIFLEIRESGGTKNVKLVGYHYAGFTEIPSVPPIISTKETYYNMKSAPVYDTPGGRFALITEFKQTGSSNIIVSDFDDNLYLLDENRKVIGHMYYEYEFKRNREQVRNALLILHNDPGACNAAGGAVFPYSGGFPGWTYYKSGEYPVSMLIPPLNKFPVSYFKKPVLLLHGLTGKYEYAKWAYFFGPVKITGNLADPLGEDVSYWFTTPEILNTAYNYDTWQMYYPDNDAASTVSECLRYDLSLLRSLYPEKINLVTHSYGGLITGNYLSNYQADAQASLSKVLFLAPPFHGSFAANRGYEDITITGSLTSFFDGIQNKALCYRDASLGSDLITKNWNALFPDLNGKNGASDDYFVIAGAISKNYTTEAIHEEALDHSDGMVSISSASLLDRNIGFATLAGNHDDLIHALSNHPGQVNIGDKLLIPKIINEYISVSFDTFLLKLKTEPDFSKIMAVVNYDKSVIKPKDKNISNLKTSTDENYQRSLLVFEVQNLKDSPGEFTAYYNPKLKQMVLLGRGNIYNYLVGGYNELGTFWKNKYTSKYYFHDGRISGFNLSKLSPGCAIDLTEGTNTIIVCDRLTKLPPMNVDINYCQSKMISFDFSEINNAVGETNSQSAIKTINNNLAGLRSIIAPIEFFVDDRTSLSSFIISGASADIPVSPHLIKPDGSELIQGWYKNDTTGMMINKVNNPPPGTWQLWIEDLTPALDTLTYSLQACHQSEIKLEAVHLSQAELNKDNQVSASLNLPHKADLSQAFIRAMITTPRGASTDYDISTSRAESDSGYVYTLNFSPDTTGIYFISFNCSGTYNNYKFERYVADEIAVIDKKPVLRIPDVELGGLNTFARINLNEQVYCNQCDRSLFKFSSNLLSNNDVVTYIDTASVSYISTGFINMEPALVEFLLKSGDKVLCRDTVIVTKRLPDLKIKNFELSNDSVDSGKNITVSFDIANESYTYTNSDGNAAIVLSLDNVYDKNDLLLLKPKFPVLAPGGICHISKEMTIPAGLSIKYPYMLVFADSDTLVFETSKSNNLLSTGIEFVPQVTFQKGVFVDPGSGEVIFIEPNSFSGGIINYNGYGVAAVPWWYDYNIWAYSGSGTLPLWINYRFNIDNYENLDSVKVSFTGRGTSSNGIYYSYLFLQVNDKIIFDNDKILIDAPDWVNYNIILPSRYFNSGINNIKVGTSSASQTYVALRQILVDFKYRPNLITILNEQTPVNNDEKLVIFPNPVNGDLYFKNMTHEFQAEIFELSGRKLFSGKISSTRIDVSWLRSGTYIIKVSNNGSAKSAIFIKL